MFKINIKRGQNRIAVVKKNNKYSLNHTGKRGLQGDTGIAGDTGNAGIAGAKGDTGNQGNTGVQGDTGIAGDTGNQGIQGNTGVTGATGVTGDQGDTGTAGAKGDTGTAGTKGDTGNAGSAGAKGDTGTQGDTGAGEKGDTGNAGAKGDTGNQGTTGATGAQGVKGDTGDTGATTALDNLASVAINTSLISDTDSTDDLGSSSKYWANTYTDKLYLNATAALDGSTGGVIGITGSFGSLPSVGTLKITNSAPIIDLEETGVANSYFRFVVDAGMVQYRDGASLDFMSKTLDGTATGVLKLNSRGGYVGVGPVLTPNAQLHSYDSVDLGGTTNDVERITNFQGKSGNTLSVETFLRRKSTGSDWTTVIVHESLNVDTAFGTPGTDTRCWYERDINAQSHKFGSTATTYLTLTSGLASVTGDTDVSGVYKVDNVQVVSNRVVDARADDTVNTSTWDSTTAGVLDALRDAMITHGLIAAA